MRRVVAHTTIFPSGSFVVTEKGEYYIQDKTRLAIPSENIRDSWRFAHSFLTEEVNLRGYPIVGRLGFRAGTVFFSLGDGKYYLVEKNKKRHITNSRWFDYLGLNRLDVVAASADEASLHGTGEVLN